MVKLAHIVLTASLALAPSGIAFVSSSAAACEAHQRKEESYSARGVIKSFGAERRSVSIAHEAIPGFMGAMTMTFDVKSPDTLRGLAVDDHVSFTFIATADGHHVVQTITKETK